jgi:hypothetical protein
LTSISQTNGKISATYSNIAFPVTSVAGRTGAITLDKPDVNLGNVANYSQTNTPTSGSSLYFTAGGAYTLKADLQDYTDNAINALDVTAKTGTTTQTITSISQTDGKISATYSNIAFPVTSVAGKTGAVTLSKSDVGLGNVANYSQTATPTSGSNLYFTAAGAYNLKTNLQDYTDNAIGALDVTAITGSTTKTITSISQTDGKISATYSDIAFPSVRNEIEFIASCQIRYATTPVELFAGGKELGSDDLVLIVPTRMGVSKISLRYTDDSYNSVYAAGPIRIRNITNINMGISSSSVEYIDGTTKSYKSLNVNAQVEVVYASTSAPNKMYYINIS